MTRRALSITKIVVTLLLACGGVGAYFMLRGAGEDAVTFKTARIDRGPVEQTVTATGQLNAVTTVQVGSQVSGVIQSLGADFNSQVKAGQIVAQIDPTRFKANLEQAQAAFKNAEASAARARVNVEMAGREYARARALADKQVIGEAELDTLKAKNDLAAVELQSAEAGIAQARASVGMARVDLERTTIRSPIAGVVLQRAVDVGQTVAASLSAPTLFTIAQDLSKMEVRAAIDEADVGKLTEGLEARFTVDAHPGREFVATIHQIRSNPNVLQNVVTYDAILRVDNSDGKLRPGMTANVRIVTEHRDDVLRVPNTAIRFRPPVELILATASNGRPGAGRSNPDAGAWAGGGGDRQWRRREGGGGPPGARGSGEGVGHGAGGGPVRRITLYRASGNKLQPVAIRPGISDEQFTEVARGEVAAGDEIVIEATGSAIPPPLQRPAGGPMGGGQRRGGGPRFF